MRVVATPLGMMLALLAATGCKPPAADASHAKSELARTQDEMASFESDLRAKGPSMLLTVTGGRAAPTFAAARYLAGTCGFDHGGFSLYDRAQIVQLLAVAEDSATIINEVPAGVVLTPDLSKQSDREMARVGALKDAYEAQALVRVNDCPQVTDALGKPMSADPTRLP
jgi:hypothetical protein